MATLKTYASGDGALSFVWMNGDEASGKTVTEAQARAWLKNRKDAAHLREENWRVVMLNGRPEIVAHVQRVNDNTVLVNGKTYNISIDKKYVHDGRIFDAGLLVTFDFDEERRGFTCHNWNTRGVILHFLNNEAALNAKPNDFHDAIVEGVVREEVIGNLTVRGTNWYAIACIDGVRTLEEFCNGTTTDHSDDHSEPSAYKRALAWAEKQ